MLETYIGIDPGYLAGGIVILSDSRALGAASWRRLRRKSGDVWRVDIELFDAPLLMKRAYCGSFWEALDTIWGALPVRPYHLAVEQPFIPKGRMSGLVKLIESTGGLLGVFGPAALSVQRPTPNQWRKSILNLGGRTPAAEAEREAVRWTQETMNLGTLRDNGHVCEAACIALWMRNNAPSPSLTLLGPSKPA